MSSTLTLTDLIKITVAAFNNPSEEFELRTYLTRKTIERPNRVQSRKIEKQLGGNGEDQ